MANKDTPFGRADFGAPPKRVGEPQRAAEPRHPLRPPEDYVEFEEESKLRIPRHQFPDGFDLQWVTHSVFGKEEPQHKAKYQRQGWVTVLAEEWGGKYGRMFMPDGYQGEINVDGLVLMARPESWSAKARALEAQRARERVYLKEQQLRSGELGRVTMDAQHPTAVRSNIVNRVVEQIPVVPD